MLIETELSETVERLDKALMLCHNDDFKSQVAGKLIRESLEIINDIIENLENRPRPQTNGRPIDPPRNNIHPLEKRQT